MIVERPSTTRTHGDHLCVVTRPIEVTFERTEADRYRLGDASAIEAGHPPDERRRNVSRRTNRPVPEPTVAARLPVGLDQEVPDETARFTRSSLPWSNRRRLGRSWQPAHHRPGRPAAQLAGLSELGGGALTALGLANPLGPIVARATTATAAIVAPPRQGRICEHRPSRAAAGRLGGPRHARSNRSPTPES